MESLIRDGQIHFPPENQPPFLYLDRAALDAAIVAGDVPRDGKGRPLLRADLPDLDFWVDKPIARKRISRIVRKGPEHDNATRPLGSWIAGLNETVSDDAQTLRSDRQGVATAEIEALFGEKAFSFPKPLSLIRSLVRACAGEGDIVLDFFAGSGTTGHAVLALNAEDDANRRFIMVSSTEAAPDNPDRNLCRDICAARLRKAITGDTPAGPLPGDFAYLRTQRIRWDDILYDLDPTVIWTLLQLRHDRPLCALDPSTPVQIAAPEEPGEPVLVYVPAVTDDAIALLHPVAARGPVIGFATVPGLLRDRLGMESVPIEQIPDRLLAEFPRVVAGL